MCWFVPLQAKESKWTASFGFCATKMLPIAHTHTQGEKDSQCNTEFVCMARTPSDKHKAKNKYRKAFKQSMHVHVCTYFESLIFPRYNVKESGRNIHSLSLCAACEHSHSQLSTCNDFRLFMLIACLPFAYRTWWSFAAVATVALA